MKKVIHIPKAPEYILSSEVDFNKQKVKVFDELQFTSKLIGSISVLKGRLFVESKETNTPIIFNNGKTVFFDNIDTLFELFKKEGYSAYID